MNCISATSPQRSSRPVIRESPRRTTWHLYIGEVDAGDVMRLPRDVIPKKHWRSIGLLILFLSYAVITPPHTVHHGLHDGAAQECSVATIATQTTGDLPDILPWPTPALCIVRFRIIQFPPPKTPAFHAYKSRGPPPSADCKN